MPETVAQQIGEDGGLGVDQMAGVDGKTLPQSPA
jgi:hypothetical protein